ncbi:MAG: dihydroorotate dehydrogenase electron transfer subunit [Dehalococcoidales bacterium]|nr:dihydroorotate dehydrogenase electron transfer subunit [Dehalococcoidales bacterium]
MKQCNAPIISNTEVMPGVHLVWLECPDIAALATPGQFIMVRCQGETLLRRPISVHQVNQNKSRLALLFAAVGKGTTWLAERQKGESLDIFGPLGNGFSVSADSKNLLLVAGGLGIAPLRFLADEAIKQGKKVTLLMGASSSVRLLPEGHLTHGLLTDGVLPFNITIMKATDDGSEGFRGLVTTLIIDKNCIDAAHQVFACGPMPMYKAMSQMPEVKGKPVQVSLETNMACGFGVCYGCTIKTRKGLKQVCKDGPVFDLDDIVW